MDISAAMEESLYAAMVLPGRQKPTNGGCSIYSVYYKYSYFITITVAGFPFPTNFIASSCCMQLNGEKEKCAISTWKRIQR